MATYISLVNWTDQGIKSVKDSPGRLDGARALAKKYGCTMKDFYLTIGAADMVAILEGPDDESVAKFSLALGSSGSVRTTTMKAFSEESYRKIIGSL
jgi:uncharacterized protein with GYD domain